MRVLQNRSSLICLQLLCLSTRGLSQLLHRSRVFGKMPLKERRSKRSKRMSDSRSDNREIRLQIMLMPDELQAIDDWRFAKRMPSRASAVRELLHRGLAAEGFKAAQSGQF